MKKKSIRIQTKNIMDYPIIPLIIPKKDGLVNIIHVTILTIILSTIICIYK